MRKDLRQQIVFETVVGLFVFAVLALLVTFTIILSREAIFAPRHYREILFEDVQGLREGDTVTARGLAVGKVRRIWLDPSGVRVQVALDQDLRVHEVGYRIRIVPASVLGGQLLEIFEGDRDSRPLPANFVLRGEKPVDIIDQATETITLVRQALEDGGILRNLESAVENVQVLSQGLRDGEGTIGRLLTDDQLYTDFAAFAATLREVSDGIQAGQGTLGRLVKEDGLYEDASATMANLRQVSQRVADGEGALGKLLSDDDQVFQDLAATMASLRAITERIEAGEGTLGKLTADDEVYRQLVLMLQEVRAAVDDFRETAPITTFSSILFGAF